MNYNDLYHEEEVKPRGLLALLHLDTVLTLLLAALCLFSLIILYSASNQDIHYVTSQAIKMGIGFVAMVIIAFIPPTLIKRATPLLYIIGIVALLLLFVIGVEVKGAVRWLDLKVFRFQPSEVAKLATPMMIAYYLDRSPLPPTLFRSIVTLLILFIPFSLVFMQPDLGTAIVIVYSAAAALFLAGFFWRYILIIIAILAISLPLYWHYGMKPYQKDRVVTFLNPESDPLGKGYQIIQSKTAIGSGGLYGKGWQNSTQASLKFLPESTTDFIYAITAEEFGLMGTSLLLGIYLLIIIRSFYIASRGRDNYFRLIGGTICLSLFFYIFVNAGMVSGLLPIVGIPLPFISYGGTSIVTLFISFGILMNIYSHQKPNIKRIF